MCVRLSCVFTISFRSHITTQQQQSVKVALGSHVTGKRITAHRRCFRYANEIRVEYDGILLLYLMHMQMRVLRLPLQPWRCT